jgi:uncharacterized membrane protein
MGKMENNSHKTIALTLFGFLSTALLTTRIILTGEITFLFLAWNLFLAYIPYGLSTLVRIKTEQMTSFQFRMVCIPWLLFFPNAPYILTDLFHLSPRSAVPEWYDLLLILSFAITGLLLGLFSLRNMHRTLLRFHSPATGYIFAFASIYLAAFGVYLGRFERYNSWDIFRTPDDLFLDITQRLMHPLQHFTTWGVTVGYGSLILLIYFLMIGVDSVKSNQEK